jgi:hypothetical protein
MKSPLILLVLTASACASAGRSKPTTIAHTSPELIGCSAYTPPDKPWLYANRVLVQMTVKPDGTVLPGSARHVSTRYERTGKETIDQAVDMAESCRFKPVSEETTASIEVAFN